MMRIRTLLSKYKRHILESLAISVVSGISFSLIFKNTVKEPILLGITIGIVIFVLAFIVRLKKLK